MRNDTTPDSARAQDPHDQFEEEADRLLEEFKKDDKRIELLGQASELYRQSVHPEGHEISNLLRGLYHLQKAKAEPDDLKAIGDLRQAYRLLRKAGLKPDELREVRLNWLKRRISLAAERKERKILPGLFLKSAILLEKSEREKKDFHVAMFMHHLYTLVNLGAGAGDGATHLDRMMLHARKSGEPNVIYKASVIAHRIRANQALRPADAVVELEKALEAIRQTSDRFGEEEARASLLLSRALTTGRRGERKKLLEEAAMRFEGVGERGKAVLARRMAAPIPVSVAATIASLDKSLVSLHSLGKTVQELKTGPAGPAALFYHQSYLIERIKDVSVLLGRLGATRKQMTELSIREGKLTPKRVKYGRPASKELQALFRKQDALRSQMKLDMESLYIFGNLVLDQWAHLIAYLAGLKEPEEFTFNRLVSLLQAKNYAGILKPLWGRQYRDILWLYYQLRFFRNIFVEHLKRPWQRGSTMSVFGEDFNLLIPTPPGWEDEGAIQAELQSISQYAPKWLKDAPDDYWEKRNPRRVLEITFMHIDEIPEQTARDRVWKVWSRVGGSTPSYEIVAHRLARLIEGSIPTLIGIASAHPNSINLGRQASTAGIGASARRQPGNPVPVRRRPPGGP